MALAKILGADSRIDNWFISFPSSVFVQSNLKSAEIRKLITGHIGDQLMFIIEINKYSNYSARVIRDHVKYFEQYADKIELPDSSMNTKGGVVVIPEPPKNPNKI